MTTKEYETLARDLDEGYTASMQRMEAMCIEHIQRNIDICNDQLAARDAEFKTAAIGIFVCGGLVGAIIAAILLKV